MKEGVESGFWPESDVVSESLGALARPRSAAPRAPFRLDAYFMPSGKNRKHTIDFGAEATCFYRLNFRQKTLLPEIDF